MEDWYVSEEILITAKLHNPYFYNTKKKTKNDKNSACMLECMMSIKNSVLACISSHWPYAQASHIQFLQIKSLMFPQNFCDG